MAKTEYVKVGAGTWVEKRYRTQEQAKKEFEDRYGKLSYTSDNNTNNPNLSVVTACEIGKRTAEAVQTFKEHLYGK